MPEAKDCNDSVIIEDYSDDHYKPPEDLIKKFDEITDECKNCPLYCRVRRALERLFPELEEFVPEEEIDDLEVIPYYQKISKRNS